MINLSSKSKRQLLFITVAAVAILTRAILLAFWLDSPVRYYSMVGGLDMKTLLDMGALFYQSKNTFALYNLLIAGTMFFNNGIISIISIIIIQQLMGVATSLLTAWICLKLTGKKMMALAAGITAALYAPALIYEAITLRESMFSFTAILALAILIKLHRQRFSTRWLLLTGIVITLPLSVRLSALLWLVTAVTIVIWSIFYSQFHQNNNLQLSIKKTFKKLMVLLLGIILVIVTVAALNLKQSGGIAPISRKYIQYIFTMGRKANPQTVNLTVPDKSSALTVDNHKSLTGFAYLNNNIHKFSKLFCQYEIPNNINYYFMRQQLFPGAVLPGPGLVIPLALVGIILLFIRRKFLHKEALLLLYIMAFAIPITLFLPLGRYRLILYPVFAIVMFYPLDMIFSYLRELTLKGQTNKNDLANESENGTPKVKKITILKICGIVVLTGIIYTITLPGKNSKIRSSDYTTHGKAMQQQEGDTANVENYFALAYQLNPTAPAVAINYTDILLKQGKMKQALQAILPAWNLHPKNSGVVLFASSALLCNGMAKQAELILLNAGAPTAEAGRQLYFHNLSESYRLQGKHK